MEFLTQLKILLENFKFNDLIFPTTTSYFLIMSAITVSFLLGCFLMWWILVMRNNISDMRKLYRWGRRDIDHTFFEFYVRHNPDFDTLKECSMLKFYDTKTGVLTFLPVKGAAREDLLKHKENLELLKNKSEETSV
jgi:hypothetical protein